MAAIRIAVAPVRSAKTNTLIIQTPEGVEFSYLLAGPVTRALAWAIDFACIATLVAVLGSLCRWVGLLNLDFAMAILGLGYFAISFGYGMVLEWYWRGQTVGKKMLRLRVIDVQGLRLQFSQIALRNLLRIVDSLPFLYLVGGMACLFNRRTQRLGDFAANTVVVWNPKSVEPNLEQIMAGKFNSFREYPHLEARLRQRVSPEEAGIALQALLRRETLEPQARVDLFADIAAYFREIAPFPEEASLGLTDEQYVRNVVDALYRPRAAEAPPAQRRETASAS